MGGCDGDKRGKAEFPVPTIANVETSFQAATTGSDIDRVLGFEATTLSDWSIIWNGPGALSISTNSTQGWRSLAVAAHGYVPIQSVALSSLGTRVGTAIHLDIMLPSELKQVSPYWFGLVQLYASIPSLAVNNQFVGQVELTPLPLATWNTVTIIPSSTLLSALRKSYSDLRITVAINAPYNATKPYLLDNLRFSDQSVALVKVVDGGGRVLPGATVVAYNGNTPTPFSGVTDSTGTAKISLPPGHYRFGMTEAGVTTFSSPTNGCNIPGACPAATIVAKCHGITCFALDQCHQAGTCDPGTGMCSNPTAQDGTPCDDGSLCTQTDRCQNGACLGENPVVCEPQDGCHDPGMCDDATGTCSNPANPGGPACVVSDGWTPSTPILLRAEALSSGVVRLGWNDVDGESAYYVVRSTDGGNQFIQAKELPGGATAWDDAGRAALTTYCYKVRAKAAAGYASSNMVCVKTPLRFEAEEVPSTSSDGTTVVVADAGASAGKYAQVPLAGASSWVDFVLTVPITGTFRLKVRQATGPDRGRWRLQVDGVPSSMEVDGYSPQPANTEVDLGEIKIDSTANPKHFRFLLTGKHEHSTGNVVAVDAFALSNVGIRYEAEESYPTVNPPNVQSNLADSTASNGAIASAALSGSQDSLSLTLGVSAPGKYQIVLRYGTGPDRGVFQTKLDGVEIGGEIDAYSTGSGFATKAFDPVEISSGAHVLSLVVTGKSGGSSGYGVSVDYVELRPGLVIVERNRGQEPVILEATYGCGSPPDPQTKSGVVDLDTDVAFTIPRQIPVVTGNAGNKEAKLVFRTGSRPAITCTYLGGTNESHPADRLEYLKGLKYVLQTCSNGAQAGAAASANHFELTLMGADCQYASLVTMARVHLGGDQCSDESEPFISPDETHAIRTQFSWADTLPVAETGANGDPTLWYALIYIHDRRQPEALDSLLIHHQKPPIFIAPGQPTPRLCGTLNSAGDGEGYFEYALLTGVAFNKLRSLAIAAGTEVAQQGLFQTIKIISPPVPEATMPDGSVSISYLQSAGFRYMGYLAGQTITHPDGTTETIPRAWSWDPFSWAGDAWDGLKGCGEWVAGKFGDATNFFLPSVSVHVQLRATSSDPAFQGQELVKGWGKNAGKPIGIPGVRVNLWYMSLSVLSPYGGTTDAEGKMSTEVPKYAPFAGIEIPLNGDAADIVWNGMVTHTLTDYPKDLNCPSGDKTTIVRDNKFLNYLAQFSDGRDYLKTMVGYKPHKVVASTGYAANFLASFNGGRPVVTCADFPNLVFSGTTFASWIITAFLASTVPPALLAVVPLANTLNHSDMWLPDTHSTVVHSRGVWTHEYGHFALCSMIASEGEALSTLTRMTMETIFAGRDFGPDAEARILNEAFADFFTAQVVGGTNY